MKSNNNTAHKDEKNIDININEEIKSLSEVKLGHLEMALTRKEIMESRGYK